MNTPQLRIHNSAVPSYRLPLIAQPVMCLAAIAWMGCGLFAVAGQATAQEQKNAEPTTTVTTEAEPATGDREPDEHVALNDNLVEKAAAEGTAAPAAEEAAEEAEEAAVEAAEEAGAEAVFVEQNPQLWALRRYVRVNCALARRVCELSESEEQAFEQMNDAWITKQIHESVELPGVGAMVGILRFLGGAPVEARNQQVKLSEVKDRIDLAIEEALAAEHREAFARERAARAKFRKQALAAVLVTALDESLYLSPEQRAQLEPEVAAWLTLDLYWEFYFQNSSYLPDIPRKILAKSLTAEQLAVVQAGQKHNYERSQFEDQMDQEPIMIER